VYVVGNRAELGSWQPHQGVHMSAATYPVWRAEVDLPAGTGFEFKYVKINPDGGVEWETGGNRSGQASPGCSFQDTFRD
jgi:alpha-amylase